MDNRIHQEIAHIGDHVIVCKIGIRKVGHIQNKIGHSEIDLRGIRGNYVVCYPDDGEYIRGRSRGIGVIAHVGRRVLDHRVHQEIAYIGDHVRDGPIRYNEVCRIQQECTLVGEGYDRVGGDRYICRTSG